MSRAGLLRERVTLQTATATETDAGDQAQVWADVAINVPARMQPRKVSEFMRAMRETSESRFVAMIRNRPGVTAHMRLVWKDRSFDIEGVTNADEHSHFLNLDCLEIPL